MMSPPQALARFAGGGMMVMRRGGVSREYMVGVLRTFPPHAQSNLKAQTVAAMAEAVSELKQGQELTWMCRGCGFDHNTFPVAWYVDESEPTNTPAYPSDGYFRALSKNLVAEHGAVVRVTDCGSQSAARWRFTYTDGHAIV